MTNVSQPTLFLIRGLPGSGKTTLAKRMVAARDADVWLEADLWMTGTDGVYRFDRERLSYAHDQCQRLAKLCLDYGQNVVVSNTFTRLWEMKPYFDFGYSVEVIETNGNFENVHGVDAETIERMRQRWEVYSGASGLTTLSSPLYRGG